MGHNQDFWEVLRTVLARPIGALVTGIRCTKDTPDRFVGYVEMPIEEFEEFLHRAGFERNPLSYWKKAPGLGDEDGTWRKTHGKWQLHAVLYTYLDHPDRTYIYAHWELRWDRHPLKHLRGVDLDPTKGVNQMRSLLKRRSVLYFTQTP